MIYRRATIEDVDPLVLLRKQQLIDEGIAPDQDIDRQLTAFFRQKLGDGSLVEWIGLEGDQILATAAVLFLELPPSYTDPQGIKGYITNMYTAPVCRGRGIATSLLDELVREARTRNVGKLWLSASQMGRPVYLRYGFRQADQWLELDVRPD